MHAQLGEKIRQLKRKDPTLVHLKSDTVHSRTHVMNRDGETKREILSRERALADARQASHDQKVELLVEQRRIQKARADACLARTQELNAEKAAKSDAYLQAQQEKLECKHSALFIARRCYRATAVLLLLPRGHEL